jgi:uncharacterized membrane protein YjfL (UPF0719 family)
MGDLYALAFGVGTTLALLVLFEGAQRLLSPRATFGADRAAQNLARTLLHVGDVLGVFLIAGSVVEGSIQGRDLRNNLSWVAAFGAVAILVYGVTARLGVRVLLRGKLGAELARGNVAAGVAAAGHSIGTGIVVARAIRGTDLRTLGVALVFFVVAQLTKHLLVVLFRTLTSYDDEDEIRGENLAAAISYAGATIAVSIVIGAAVHGDFQGWATSLRGFAIAAGWGVLLWPVRQIVVEGIFLNSVPSLRAGVLDRAIARDRDVGVAALEAIAYVATALVIQQLW